MRTDSSDFYTKSNAKSAQPVVVVELSVTLDNSHKIYLTSQTVDDLPSSATIEEYQNCIIYVSSTSQKLNVSNFTSTIGSIKIEAGDDGTLTDYLRAKLVDNKSPSKRRLRVYAGFVGMDFSDFSLVQTQVVKDITYNKAKMVISCLDIQRETKKKIFDPKVTILTGSLGFTDINVNVQNATAFEMVYHGPSYTDAPNTVIGYAMIKDGDDYEIFSYTGKTTTSFTGVTRGVLGTLAQEWHAVDNEGQTRELEVTEFIYLELPVAKLIYAILTGTLYGDGATLPDHWHLGIDTQWVSTSQFVNLPNTIWNENDDTQGRICYFEGIEEQDGRKFINEELLPMISCYMPISGAGELGLKLIASVLSTSPYAVYLNEDSIKNVSPVRYAMDEVLNQYQVDWSYDYIDKEFRRTSLFYDSSSALKYGTRDIKILPLKGMHGNRHSRDFIKSLFQSLRDRFGGEPLYVRLDIKPGLNNMEVGDTVRVNLANWEDYTGGSTLNRTFEIQGVTVDWLKGNVSVDLFGSSQNSGAINDDGEGYNEGGAFDDALLTSQGYNIETTYPGQTSRSGDLVTLHSDIWFIGEEVLTEADGTPNPDAILYCNGDLTIAPGVNLNISHNVVLIVTGFLAVNGTINGAGLGPAGGDYRRTNNVQVYSNGAANYQNINAAYAAPTPGFMHSVLTAQGGMQLFDHAYSYGKFISFHDNEVEIPEPNPANLFVRPQNNFPYVPEYEINVENIGGLPGNLRGGSGPAGGPVSQNSNIGAHGGDGGAGGAGLVTIARGMSFGASGKIDLSGGPSGGNQTSHYAVVDSVGLGKFWWGGAGCGGSPGSWICLIDGGGSVAPLVDGGSFIANYGAGGIAGNPVPAHDGSIGSIDTGYNGMVDPSSSRTPTSVFYIGSNSWQPHHRVQFVLPPNDAPGEETPASSTGGNVSAFSLTEYTNTPNTPAGNRSTIEVSVTPPVGDANYAYAKVYYRLWGTAAWIPVSIPAQNETTFVVTSDGATYEVQVRSVSITGFENLSGPTQSITVSTLVGVLTA